MLLSDTFPAYSIISLTSPHLPGHPSEELPWASLLSSPEALSAALSPPITWYIHPLAFLSPPIGKYSRQGSVSLSVLGTQCRCVINICRMNDWFECNSNDWFECNYTEHKGENLWNLKEEECYPGAHFLLYSRPTSHLLNPWRGGICSSCTRLYPVLMLEWTQAPST